MHKCPPKFPFQTEHTNESTSILLFIMRLSTTNTQHDQPLPTYAPTQPLPRGLRSECGGRTRGVHWLFHLYLPSFAKLKLLPKNEIIVVCVVERDLEWRHTVSHCTGRAPHRLPRSHDTARLMKVSVRSDGKNRVVCIRTHARPCII